MNVVRVSPDASDEDVADAIDQMLVSYTGREIDADLAKEIGATIRRFMVVNGFWPFNSEVVVCLADRGFGVKRRDRRVG